MGEEMSKNYRIVEFDDGTDEYIVEFTIDGTTRTMLVAPVLQADGVTIDQDMTRAKIQREVSSYTPQQKQPLRNPRDLIGTSEDVLEDDSSQGFDSDAFVNSLIEE